MQPSVTSSPVSLDSCDQMEGGPALAGTSSQGEEQRVTWFGWKWLVSQGQGGKPETALRLGTEETTKTLDAAKQRRGTERSHMQRPHHAQRWSGHLSDATCRHAAALHSCARRFFPLSGSCVPAPGLPEVISSLRHTCEIGIVFLTFTSDAPETRTVK